MQSFIDQPECPIDVAAETRTARVRFVDILQSDSSCGSTAITRRDSWARCFVIANRHTTRFFNTAAQSSQADTTYREIRDMLAALSFLLLAAVATSVLSVWPFSAVGWSCGRVVGWEVAAGSVI